MLIVSIILEAAVAILAIRAARKGKPYVYGLAFIFGAYVLYDLARFAHMDVQEGALSALFLLATISALIAMWACTEADSFPPHRLVGPEARRLWRPRADMWS